MSQTKMDDLPEIELVAIGPDDTELVAPLLTPEAVEYINSGMAFGMAAVEEEETRAAVCARLLPENDAVLEIISLYVAPAFRRRGLGGTLLMELIEETMEATDGGIRWVTSAFDSQIEGLEALLTKAGFAIEYDNEAVTWQLTMGELASAPLMEHKAAASGLSLCPLKELSEQQIKQLVNILIENYVDYMSVQEIRQALAECSYVAYSQNNTPVACSVFTALSEEKIVLSQFFSKTDTSSLLAVLQASAAALIENYPADTILEIPTLTRSSAKLVEKLLPCSKAVRSVKSVLELV